MRPARSRRMAARRQPPGRPAPANSRHRGKIALRVVGVPGIVCSQQLGLENSWWVQYRGPMRGSCPRDAGCDQKSDCPRNHPLLFCAQTQETPLTLEWRFPPVLHWSLASQTSWVRWFASTALIQTSRPVFPFEGRSVGGCSCRASAVLRAGHISFQQPVHHWHTSYSNLRAN